MNTETNPWQRMVLDALQSSGPMSNHQLQLRLGISMGTARNALQRLKKKGRIRIASYEFDDSQSLRLQPVYAAGGGESAKNPALYVQVKPIFNALQSARVHRQLGVWAGLMR